MFIAQHCSPEVQLVKGIYLTKTIDFYVACDVTRPSTWLREFLSSGI